MTNAEEENLGDSIVRLAAVGVNLAVPDPAETLNEITLNSGTRR
jgi:hypothetical protein